MALKQLFVMVVLVAAIALPRIASATEFIVGDDKGWTTDFDYQAWAKDKAFHVGDQLLFNYPVGFHNVYKVNGTSFKDCIVPPSNEAFTTGKDVIPLATPGNKWYICGIEKHCADKGQKLAITVLPEVAAPAPEPVAPNSAIGVVASGCQILIAAIVSIAMIFVG